MPDRVNADAYGFDTKGAAAAYERARPSYPAEAVAYIVDRADVGPGQRVLDLAAGTGKLTRSLVEAGADVVAVEPMAAMREQLSQALPGVEVLEGTAEALPLPSESIATVTVGHAFHWFDPPAALSEIRRVLRKGGHLFLLWNMRDRSIDWVRAYGQVLFDQDVKRPYDSYYDVDYARVIAEAVPGAFTPAEVWSHRWEQVFDEELLVARTASISVVGTMDDQRRAAALDRVRNLVRTHPDLAGRSSFGLGHVTTIWHCRAQEGDARDAG